MTAASDLVQRSTDRTYWAWDSDRWETKSPGWPQFNEKDVTAQVRVSPSDNVGIAGLQNWVLKIERYNL